MLELIEKPCPQVRQDLLPDRADAIDLLPTCQRANHVHGEKRGHPQSESAGVRLKNILIDRLADQVRPTGLSNRANDDVTSQYQELAPIRPKLADQAARHGATVSTPLVRRREDRFNASGH